MKCDFSVTFHSLAPRLLVYIVQNLKVYNYYFFLIYNPLLEKIQWHLEIEQWNSDFSQYFLKVSYNWSHLGSSVD